MIFVKSWLIFVKPKKTSKRLSRKSLLFFAFFQKVLPSFEQIFFTFTSNFKTKSLFFGNNKSSNWIMFIFCRKTKQKKNIEKSLSVKFLSIIGSKTIKNKISLEYQLMVPNVPPKSRVRPTELQRSLGKHL